MTTSRIIGLVLAGLVAGCAAASHRADQADSCSPIVIDSDRMEVDRSGSRVIFTGQVVAKLDSATLTADRMEVDMDEKGTRVLRIVSTGNVKLVTADGRHGTARRAVYDDEEQHVTLLDDAKVLDGDDAVLGEKVTVYLDEALRAPAARCARQP
jgi:lipopolysaccharide export system protein LptA